MKCIKQWALSIVGIALVWQAFHALGCAATAYAAPEDWRPAASTGPDVTQWLLGAVVALQIADMVLPWISRRTKNTWDDELASKIHALHDTAAEILTHVRGRNDKVP